MLAQTLFFESAFYVFAHLEGSATHSGKICHRFAFNIKGSARRNIPYEKPSQSRQSDFSAVG